MTPELHQLHLEAGRRVGQEKTCGKKVKYADEAAGLKAAASHNKWKDRRHDVEPYPCAFCSQWHVGQIMPEELLQQIIGDECNCGCHDPNRGMVHVVACCSICPLCSKRIKNMDYQSHKDKCYTAN